MMQTLVDDQLNQIRQSLGLQPEQIDTSHLLPMFVPASFFAMGNWPGPYARLRTADLGLTWAVLFPHQTLRYVDDDMLQYWELCRIDWKEIAMRNLQARTQGANIHQLRRPNRPDGKLVSMAFMSEDGLGPSRLLFRGTLNEQFPEGYRVAIPEMSCGVAFSKNAQDPELTKILTMVADCYQKGTKPLSPGIYDPEDLLPVDTDD
jgi:hypothetical protein